MLRVVCVFPRKNICHLPDALVNQLFVSTNLVILREKSKLVGEDEGLPQPKSLHDEADDLDALQSMLPGRLKREREDRQTSWSNKSAHLPTDKNSSIENRLNNLKAAMNLYAQKIVAQNDEIRYLKKKLKDVEEDQCLSPKAFEETTKELSLHINYERENIVKQVEKSNHFSPSTQRTQLPNSSQKVIKRKEMGGYGSSSLAESFKLLDEDGPMKEYAQQEPFQGQRKEVGISVKKKGVREMASNANVPQEKAKKSRSLGKIISKLTGDERLGVVQNGILSTTANESSKIHLSSLKSENSRMVLTDLALCLGSEWTEERVVNLMQLSTAPLSHDRMTQMKKDRHLSALGQCLLLDPELREYPRLHSFLIGHKKVKNKSETTPTETFEGVFNVFPSLQLFGNREELIECAEDVYNSQDIEQPCNGFEVHMINNGQQWKYPIDNEADNRDDRYSFSDHVFLDHHLDDFPQVEPVRQYMELVIVGLQKNPFLTYDKKISRILWYKKFFAKFSEDVLN